MNKRLISSIFLLCTAIIWGSGFVAQRAGMDSIGPIYFSAFRMILASLSICVVYLVSGKNNRNTDKPAEADVSSQNSSATVTSGSKTLLIGGICCGVILFFATNLQQIGLVTVDAGKSGFITTLYIVLVPLLGLFLKQRPTVFNLIGVVLGAIGLYFLCITEEFSIMPGDLITLIGALFWALHILFIDHFVAKVDVLKLTAIQFLVVGIISFIVAFFTEEITTDNIISAAPAILYMAVFSSAIAFTLQAYGQKYANPTASSIILSTESLFAVIFGFIFLGEVLSNREIIGCILMLAAAIIAQIPTKEEQKNEQTGSL